MLRDLWLAIRSLRQSPGYALVVIPTLALGIGANTAIFSVVYGVLLRPLPYHDPDALVVIQGERDFPSGTRIMNFSAPELDDWVQHSRAFAALGMSGGGGYVLTTDEGVEPVSARHVSDGFFATAGQPMLLGRPLGRDDTPVVVMSHRLWLRRFGGDPAILGRSITLSQRAFTIVGIAPPDFRLPDGAVDVWIPLAYARANSPASSGLNNRNGGGHQVIARLEPGVTLEQARRDVVNVIGALEPHFNEARRGTRPRITPLTTYVASVTDGSTTGGRRSVQPVLLVLLAAIGLVLLLACANVANLMLAREARRARDVAVRIALGAARHRLIRQSLAESAMLALAGAAAGVVFAAGSIAILQRLRPTQLPRLDDIRIDGPVVLFAIAAAVVTVVLSALVPALRASRPDLVTTLKAGARTQSGDGPGARRVRAVLVVAELAIAIMLMVGATLLARSLVALLQTDLGVSTENVIAAQMDLSLGRTLPESRWLELGDALVARVSGLPGVEATGVGSGLPPAALYMRRSFTLASGAGGQAEEHMVSLVPASPGYFTALRISLVAGRLFTDADGPNAPQVVIVSDDGARRFFGTRDPIGQTLPIGPSEGPIGSPVTVVGVVRNVKYTGIDAPVEAVLYRPYSQTAGAPIPLFLVARVSDASRADAADIRQAIRATDPQINISSLRMLDETVSTAVAQPRFRTVLLSSIAGLALVLSIVGLYGVIAYSVSQRTAEIGLRMAIGATTSDVMAMVLKEGLWLAAVGSVVGLAGAYALARTLTALLYGVVPADPMSFGMSAATLLIVALIACCIPAWRAARVDPIVALRAE